MTPVVKSVNDSKQFSIIDVVISLSQGESLRKVSTRMKVSITVLLHENTPGG